MIRNHRHSVAGIFIVTYHLALIIALPWYLYTHSVHLSTALAATALFFISGIAITAGYHRLYSHRSYKASTVVEAVLLWFGSVATQGSVLRWCNDHRLHHAHTDSDQDPYSIGKGFWYAHMMWLFDEQAPINPKVVPDLMNNKLVVFQDNYYPLLMVVTNVVTCAAVGWMCNDYVGAFVLAGLLRLFGTHHATWFINSLAHTWGWKPFCQEQSAVDNFMLSLVTFGEGYHNYHHTFANDYRNGVRWFHFDPTKWLIWTLSMLGLASGLKKVDTVVIKKRMVLERRNLLLQQLSTAWTQGQQELQTRVQELSDRLVDELTTLGELTRQMADHPAPKELRRQLADLKKNLKHDWDQWVELSHNILKPSRSPVSS